MTRPRSQLVSLEATPYYHCISRCVRRAFLCGKDRYSGKSFDHRKPWLVQRLGHLAEIFAIDIAAFAVMSNHYHLVLHIDQARAQSWSDTEVIKRWTRLYKGPSLIQQYKAGIELSSAELKVVAEMTKEIRSKLYNISKFMACMNEYIARKANLEDGCTGRFWEGRFKSQALLDETALLSCMTYVDLNPIRAGIALNLEKSDFTSIQCRILQIQQNNPEQMKGKTPAINTPQPPLMPFRESLRESDHFSAIPYNLRDYLELADWTGRAVRPDKSGSIHDSTPKLLSVLALSESQWKILALDIQKKSITMLHGLNTLVKIETKAGNTLAA